MVTEDYLACRVAKYLVVMKMCANCIFSRSVSSKRPWSFTRSRRQSRREGFRAGTCTPIRTFQPSIEIIKVQHKLRPIRSGICEFARTHLNDILFLYDNIVSYLNVIHKSEDQRNSFRVIFCFTNQTTGSPAVPTGNGYNSFNASSEKNALDHRPSQRH
jgi:hypothetical protein